MLASVDKKEIEMFYEYIGESFTLNPNYFMEYIEWRSTEKFKEYEELFLNLPENNADLDFRMSFIKQETDVIPFLIKSLLCS